MDRIRVCPECGEKLWRVGLVNLIVSYEVDDEKDEIFEQLWHKECFVQYCQREKEEQVNEPTL